MKHSWVLIGLIVLAGIGVGRLVSTHLPAPRRPGDLTVPLSQEPHALALDPGTGHIFVATAGLNGSHAHVSMLDAGTGATLYTTAVGSPGPVVDPRAMAVDPATGRVLEVNGDTTASVLDTRSGHLLNTLVVGTGLAQPQALAVDVGARRAFVIGMGGAALLSILDARSGGLLRTLPLAGRPQWLAVAPQAHRLLVASNQAGMIMTTVLDERTGRVLHVVGAGGPLAVDERTGRAFVANAPYVDAAMHQRVTATLAVLDLRTGRRLQEIRVGTNPSAVAVEATHGLVVVTTGSGGATPGTLVALDAATGRLRYRAAVGWTPVAVAVDDRHERVVVANGGFTDSQGNPAGSGTISVLDARNGRLLRTIAVQGSPQNIAVDARRGRAVVAARAVVPCPTPTRAAGGSGTVLDGIRALIARLSGHASQRASCGPAGSLTIVDLTH